ncbi:MAG TPA: ATP synthase F1 subunit delta [Bacteroidaceae bacterium]|nr:ATP synthase F1 subunit delta [Bacteroidaceae bacterium]
MNESQISVRYARALFKSALEKNLPDRIYEDMVLLLEISKVKEFNSMIEAHTISNRQKYDITSEILKGKISSLSDSLIKLVIDNNRELYLPGIARYYKTLYKKYSGIKSVLMVTASSIDRSIKDNLKQLLEKALKTEIELSSEVDKSIIGGFILTIGDQQYDASVAASLKKIKKQLFETSVINI